jgi:hypothetical protein
MINGESEWRLRMGKRLVLAVFLLFVWAVGVQAETAAMRSLLIHTSPKVSSLGDACSAVPDAICAEVNPAAIGFTRGTLFAFSHTSWGEDLSLGAFDVYAASARHGFGVSLVGLGSGSLEKYTADDHYDGTFRVYDVYVNGLYSYRIMPAMSLAVTGRVVYQKIDWESATGFAIDLGGLYLTPRPYLGGVWGFGLAARNLGPSVTFTDGSSDLPYTFQGGVSYSPGWLPEEVNALLALDYRKTRYEDASPLAGLEVGIADMVALRVGSRLNHSLGDMTFGAGVKFRNIMIDYAYVDYSGLLGSTHRIALSFSSGLIFPAPEQSE